MSRIAYVNGRFLPHREAAVHIEDRGYQFADGVYEVTAVQDGRLVDETLHLARLDRSLAELRIAAPMSRRALSFVLREVVRRNRIGDGRDVDERLDRHQGGRAGHAPGGQCDPQWLHPSDAA